MDNVMARPAKRKSIINIIPKFWVFFPRFRVMYYSSTERQSLIAVLTSKIVPNKTLVSPLNIKNIVSPFLIVSKVLSNFSPLFSTDNWGIGFISTVGRTKTPTIKVVKVCLIRFGTQLARFVFSCLSHYKYGSMDRVRCQGTV